MGVNTRDGSLRKGDWVRVTKPEDGVMFEGQVATDLGGLGAHSHLAIMVTKNEQIVINTNFYTVDVIKPYILGSDT